MMLVKYFLRSIFLTFLACGWAQTLYAQALIVKCTVLDSVTKEPLPYASYRLKKQQTLLVADAKGNLELVLNKAILHDTLVFTYKDHRELQIAVFKLKSNDVVMLAPKWRILDEVTVRSRTAKEDSLALRKEFTKAFIYRKPKVIEAFSLTSINVDILYASLSKKNKQKKKLRAILQRDELDNYIDSRFNRRNILKIAKLDSVQMQNFMTKHRPSYPDLKKLTDYELLQYIKAAAQKDSLQLKTN